MSGAECVRLSQVESRPELEKIRSLFLEYAQSLDFNLCFQKSAAQCKPHDEF